jgi:CheY-like chemotaxis protein
MSSRLKRPPLDGMRILVVEDNLNSAALIKQMLLAAGALEIVVASNGADARPILSSFKPDVLVTDRRMPVEDGIALITAVRQAARTPNAGVPNPAMPIVVVSGDCAPGAVREALGAGIDAFVVKPFSFDSLIKRVERAGKRTSNFVVDAGYVGPDRRRRAGRGTRRRADREAGRGEAGRGEAGRGEAGGGETGGTRAAVFETSEGTLVSLLTFLR